MTHLIVQLGGKANILTILSLISFFFFINFLFKKKITKVISSSIFAIFICMQLISLYSTQTFVGYQFYIHFNINGIMGMYQLFIFQILSITILTIILFFVFYYSNYIFNKLYYAISIKINKKVTIAIINIINLILIIISINKNSFIYDSRSILALLHNNKETFENVLDKNNMNDYITPEKIKCKPGNNIIIISAESLEKAFLTDKFSELTPNLRKLKEKWNYITIQQNEGSSWTSGSLYTYLTGFPAFFGTDGNEIFKTSYNSNISSISHVLEKAKYNMIYFNGNTRQSGVKQLLNTFHINNIVDINNTDMHGQQNHYGIRDKDLFEIAKEKIINYKSKSPFALFISTTDTHFPNGIYDKRMESKIKPQKSNLEFTIASLDYIIGDFISFLEKNNLLESTSVYIFPDHLKMGDPTITNNTGKRELYIMSNRNLKIKKDTILYQIDLPRIILNGAKVEHNLKFLSDFIKGDKNEYIKKNALSITEINTNGLLRYGHNPFTKKSESINYEEYKKDTMRFIAHAGGMIEDKLYTNTKEALDSSYAKGFRIFELDIIKTSDNKYVAAHDWNNWAKITNFKGKTPVSTKEFIKHSIHKKFTPLDMKGINEWFYNHKDAILVTDKINDPISFSKQFIDKNRLIMELFDMKALKDGLKANIRSAMPSQNIIMELNKNNDIDKLKEMGVKHIAISRRFIIDNKKLLTKLNKYGIRAYVFHINYDEGFDEEYVVKHDMDLIYGIYADKWNFN